MKRARALSDHKTSQQLGGQRGSNSLELFGVEMTVFRSLTVLGQLTLLAVVEVLNRHYSRSFVSDFVEILAPILETSFPSQSTNNSDVSHVLTGDFDETQLSVELDEAKIEQLADFIRFAVLASIKPPEQYANLLRDLAIQFEVSNLDKAYRLMNLAHRARPSGQYIKSKLEDYAARLALKRPKI